MSEQSRFIVVRKTNFNPNNRMIETKIQIDSFFDLDEKFPTALMKLIDKHLKKK